MIAFEQCDGFTKPEAADLFVQLWNDLKLRHLLKAWDTTEPSENNGEEEEQADDYEDESDKDFTFPSEKNSKSWGSDEYSSEKS